MKAGGRLRISAPWGAATVVSRRVGKAETRVDNLVVLENKM